MSAKLTQSDLANLAASADMRTNRRGRSDERRSIPIAAWAALGVLGVGMAFYFANDIEVKRKITDPDSENFSTTSPIPPSVPPEQVKALEEEPDRKFVVVKPTVAVAPPPPLVQSAIPVTPTNLEAPPPITAPSAPSIAVPSAPAFEAEPVIDNSEEIARLRALREAEAERLRALAAEAEAERLARLKSPLVVFDDGEEGKAQQASAQSSTEPVPPSTEQAAQADVPAKP